MGLLINHGKQIAEEFPVYEGDEITCKITKVFQKDKDSEYDVFRVMLECMSPPLKGKTVTDRVNYAPDHVMAWKYKRLRKAAGCPIAEGEPAQVDIEALLKNKAVVANFSKYERDDGEIFQNVEYLNQEPDMSLFGAAPSVNQTGATASQWGTPVVDENGVPF